MTAWPPRLPSPRLVAGIMSGTSLDGVDVAIARMKGHGSELKTETISFLATSFTPELRSLLMQAAAEEEFSVATLSQLNVRLAFEYASCLRKAMDQARLSAVDLIGSHGQTIRHVPDAEDCAGVPVTSTLQIGDPSVLCNLMGTPVVGDFRLADMALGGQGAPLVPYYDYVVFSHATETRGLLNLGGIANLTVLPAQGPKDSVHAFDTGCGNMVIDALAERLLGQPMDRGGAAAARGTPSEDVLAELLQDAYLHRTPPKSTGRERYGATFVDAFLARCEGRTPEDVLATATAFTARSIHQAYLAFVKKSHPLDVLIVSGGGRHNGTLMRMLCDCFAPIPVRTVDEYGIDSDAKEALCFAVLAHETMGGVHTNMIGATGASRSTLLGKICLPR